MSLDLSISPETRILADALKAVPLGGNITFASLTATIGRDVQRVARSHLDSAMRIVLRDDGVAFRSIRGIGYQRLLPEEAPEIGRAARRKLRRASKRAVQSMLAVAAASNGLPPEAQRRLSAEVSIHGLLAELAEDRSVANQAKADEAVAPAKAAQSFVDYITKGAKT